MSEDINYRQASYYAWQEGLLKQLNEQRVNTRLPHGLILHTDQSSDLSSFLWQLSTDLLCEDKNTEFHCGQCQSCQLMAANSFPDLFWVTKLYDEKKKKLKRDINVEQIRELIHQLSLTNQYNTLKIAIIYPAEALNNNAANSLLKTLEEPESDTLIILATHKLGRLPITIRSRCQQYKIPQANKTQSMQWCAAKDIGEDTVNAMMVQGIIDPITICELANEDYLELQQQCELKMLSFIAKNSELDLSNVSSDLVALPLHIMRLVINGFIEKLIQFHVDSFSHADFFKAFKSSNKRYAQKLFKIKNSVQQQLLFEENNLNVQLQINDVLLSLKAVFKN